MGGILLLLFLWPKMDFRNNQTTISAEKVNLALRRSADQLLRASGDSTSRIAPVEQLNDHVWLVKLERALNYDTLPSILQASFNIHGIHKNYDVSVITCSDQSLILGYNYLDVVDNGKVPCSGRSLPAECYNLKITFNDKINAAEKIPLKIYFFGFVFALSFFTLGRLWYKSQKIKSSDLISENNKIRFAGLQLDVINQVLISDTTRHSLTYRETKLLQLFVNHPNQILERSIILQKVWEDEGVLVGRSLDMFVSRLRKMLKVDPAVQLVAVHGVGYRMEIL